MGSEESNTVLALPPGFTTIHQLEEFAAEEVKFSRAAIAGGAAAMAIGAALSWRNRKNHRPVSPEDDPSFSLLLAGIGGISVGLIGLQEGTQKIRTSAHIRQEMRGGAEIVPNP